jgi:hypothetical protein
VLLLALRVQDKCSYCGIRDGRGVAVTENDGCFDPVTGEDKTLEDIGGFMLINVGSVIALIGGILLIRACRSPWPPTRA